MVLKPLLQQTIRCIEECERCSRACIETVMYCIARGGKHSEIIHIKMLLDCIQICGTSRDFMARGSEFSKKIGELCANICDKCAEDCDRFEDEKMKTCAAFCRNCSEACRKM